MPFSFLLGLYMPTDVTFLILQFRFSNSLTGGLLVTAFTLDAHQFSVMTLVGQIFVRQQVHSRRTARYQVNDPE